MFIALFSEQKKIFFLTNNFQRIEFVIYVFIFCELNTAHRLIYTLFFLLLHYLKPSYVIYKIIARGGVKGSEPPPQEF